MTPTPSPAPQPATRPGNTGGGNKPKPCIACRDRVAAWTTPRIDYCYECLPGGPFTPPPCRQCGSQDYFSQGLCTRCHLGAPQAPSSCRDCLAWGVIRKHKWLCWRCAGWRQKYPRGTCRICGRSDLPVNPQHSCNLCDRQAFIYLGVSVDQANHAGQQLYLANIPWPATRLKGSNTTARRMDPAGWHVPPNLANRRGAWPPKAALHAQPFYPVDYTQLGLFEMPRDLRPLRNKPPSLQPPNPQMAAFLDAAVTDHARRHGWHISTEQQTRTAMRVLQTMQDTPGALLLASDAMLLQQAELPVTTVIAVATAAGLMLDDRQPAIHAWVAATIAELPAPMRIGLTEWFDVMLNGSDTPPRRRPRSQQTIRSALRWAAPALTAWSQQGHLSLREITPHDVRAVLPPAGNPRSTMGAGLRSIFTLLRGRKTLFLNPIARIRTGGHERRQPLPADTERVRVALNSPDPACAAMTALATFHGLRASEVRTLRITDLIDGRLRMSNRTIVLAEPVRVRLNAWLAYRNNRWPNTANPHLFLNHRNAGYTHPVGGRWLALRTGIPIHILREDRILHEAQATGGDVRRICDLFGLAVEGAIRYLPPLDDPDNISDTDNIDAASSGTRTRTGHP